MGVTMSFNPWVRFICKTMHRGLYIPQLGRLHKAHVVTTVILNIDLPTAFQTDEIVVGADGLLFIMVYRSVKHVNGFIRRNPVTGYINRFPSIWINRCFPVTGLFMFLALYYLVYE
jgi:hypothetical protein